MKYSLLTVSFRGDFPWLPFLLRSIAKHVNGFDEIVIAVPYPDKHLLDKFGLTREKIFTIDESGFKCPFHAHQYYVMQADLLCEGDYIVNIDSDCLFTAPFTPEDIISADGKPTYLYTKYGPTCDSPWRPGVENLLGRPVEFEFMRRHLNTYPKDLYAKFRNHIADTHNKTIGEIIQPMGRQANLSEFNLLGAYGYYFMHDRFNWINTDTDLVPPSPIYQSWSHLLRVGEFGGDLIQHLNILATAAQPEFAKTATETLKQIAAL